ncbi:uncharacterized protein [Coffea arabica]|uniref:Uncharacterized protein LOC113741140 n=1 Tax=Coffea arabica TaxID=13443 RepID=A0A6P6XAU8_COFAR|nr:uncharacterized protein LOC113741140 [Coffea arabica]
MAEGTRFRTLEEQVKRQEIKLQELMESVLSHQSEQLQLKNNLTMELEENNKRMENLLSGMEQNFSKSLDQKFNALLSRMTTAQDKVADRGERIMMDQGPILPTPPPHQRLQPEGDQQNSCKRDWSKYQLPNPPKIDLHLFSGENPREWLRKCDKYFMNYQILENQKVEIIEMYLDGRADKWFQGIKLERPGLSWTEFGDLLCKRFTDSICKDIVEEFNKLQQGGSVREYQEQFEELKPLMLIKNRNLDENYFISSFISGLKEEIKPMLRMLKPATLTEAFELSQWQEYSLKVQNKNSKQTGEGRFGFSRGNTSVVDSNTYKVPVSNALKGPRYSNKVQEDAKEVKRISPQELQFRRSRGLCFKCGEKYGVGHQCKQGYVNCMILEDEEEAVFEDAVGEQDEQTGNPGQTMELSLHALSESLRRKTITLTGNLDGEKVFILVDTGSSDSYINSEMVIGMDIAYRMVKQPFSVIMGNGTTVTSNAICPNVHWNINQHSFRFDLKVMELEGWDIILGVDWMTHFSPITFDFQQLRISLHSEGNEIHLHGQAEDSDMDLIRGRDMRTFIEYKRQMCLALNCRKEIGEEVAVIPQEIMEVLQDYDDVFQTPKSLPPPRSVDHEILLKKEAQPFKLKPYRYPHCHKEEMEKQVEEMLQKGIVKYSNSPFASPVLLVKKKEGT